ncbi:YhgE/Pip family protein [Nocardioides sp. GCM10027113]|uniref:YhgE/Pip family protein n=1 Tax=unclassified Nocardioides TaxID=2615069 RepID=UPI00360BF788
MTIVRMALTELRRVTANRVSRAAVVALVLVPTIYGGLYLWANLDPYDHLDQLPAALVVEDTGAVMPDGTELAAGRDVADDLVAEHGFDWHSVDMAEARRGVDDGSYAFALRIPADFSASLASNADLDPERARLSLLTNDANSAVSTTIADRLTDGVRDALARRVGTEAARTFLTGFADVRTQLGHAGEGASGLAEGAGRVHDGAGRLHRGATDLAAGAGRLESGLATLAGRTAPLPEQTRLLADGARRVAEGNREVADLAAEVASTTGLLGQDHSELREELVERMRAEGVTADERHAVLEVYDQLGQRIDLGDSRVQQRADELDQLADGAEQVADGTRRLADAMPALADATRDAHDGASRLASGAGDLDDGSAELEAGLGTVERGADDLAHGLAAGARHVPDVDAGTRNRLAEMIGDPLHVASHSEARADSYGAGLAPFFLSLAAWIGGYVMFLVLRPLSRRALVADQHPFRLALGGWLAPALLGMLQMAALSGVVFVGLGIVPSDIPASVGFLMLASGTFVAIVHALVAWFGRAGQFLGLVLMVAQLVTAGGTFPWQTLPSALLPLHRVLPMSYAVDGLRQLMYGGQPTRAFDDMAVLLGWLAAALLATSLAARRQRVWTLRTVRPELPA